MKYLAAPCVAVLTVGLLSLSHMTFAQTPAASPANAPASPSHSPSPSPEATSSETARDKSISHTTLAGLQIRAGAVFGLSNTAKNAFYHKITYKGDVLSQNGTVPKNSDSTHQFLKADAGKFSDSPNLDINLIQGSGTVNSADGSGPILDTLNALGIKDFSFSKLGIPAFRGVARIAGTLDGKQANFAAGAETHAYHVPGITFANWFIPGVNYEYGLRSHSVGSDSQSGLLTYRSFFGYASWGQFGQPVFTMDDIKKAVPAVDTDKPNYEKALTRFQEAHKSTGIPELDSFLILQAGKFVPVPEGIVVPVPGSLKTQDEYYAFLSKASEAFTKSYSYEPKCALWLESDGWYTFAGDANGQRARALVAPTISYYFSLNNKTRSDIQIRYEYGFDRATPTVRQNRIIATLGLDF